MSDDYVEMKDLPKRARAAQVRKYIQDKQEALERYKAKMQIKIQAAREKAHELGVKGQAVYAKASSGMGKVQAAARKVEKHMPRKRSQGSDDLFGDMGFGGGSDEILPTAGSGSIDFGIGSGSSGSDDFGMGGLFGSPARRSSHKKHKKRKR